jgi:tetratricopeptide (TPR) repeat protein
MRMLLACCAVAFLGLGQAPPQLPPRTPPRLPGTSQGRGTPTRPAPAPSRSSPRSRSATGDALDRYAAGEYVRAIDVLLTVGGFEVTQAETWILAAAPEDVPRRRLAAAVVALEYTAARAGLSPGLYEWAAKTLREAPSFRPADPARPRPLDPHPAEALWLRASVALAEGRGAWALLTGVPFGTATPAVPAVAPDPLAGVGHLAYALSRAPDDPHLRLARVVGAEVAAGQLDDMRLSSSGPQSPVIDRVEASLVGDAPSRSRQAERLKMAAASLEPLLGHAAVGGEAHLRLGYIHLRLGESALALEHLNRVDAATREDFARCLAHLFAGWALARQGKADDAIARYRSALQVVPRARAASTLLAAELIRRGRLGEAETLVDDFFSLPPEGGDPWRWYLLGDYRAYAELIEELRGLVRGR